MLHRILIALACVVPCSAVADTLDTAEMCDRAATRAAFDANIPSNVLLAIGRLESGRRVQGALRPWPWTANVNGEGHYFDTRDDLVRFLLKTFETGQRNVDVGCFQINYRWHGDAFRSIDAMVDPAHGADYAARFLVDLHDQTGDWTLAVGAYHSRTPEFAQRYTEKYLTIARTLPPAENVPENWTEADTPRRENGFGLLRAGTGNALASLVPVDAGTVTGLFSR